ncbi:MAG: DUF58 domain-containing protein [Phycisphaerales bacterium JB050]
MQIVGMPTRPERPEELLPPSLMRRLDRLDIRSRKMFPGKLQGERRSKKRGQSVEFDDFRQYVRGDDPRFIDWNVYARMDRLVLKLFLEEEDMALHIAVDASGSMRAGQGEQCKLVYAARLAMALGYVGLVKQNRVGITVFGRTTEAGGLTRLPDIRGRHQVRRMSQFVVDHMYPESRVDTGAALQEDEKAGFNAALTSIARQRIGKGVMVVISDFLIPGGYEQGLKSLAAAGGYDTYCLQLLTPEEIDPSKQLGTTGGTLLGDLRLTDIETGGATEVTITKELMKRYRERVQEYCDGLSRYCAARAMNHMLVTTDQDIEPLILDTFRRRGLLG